MVLSNICQNIIKIKKREINKLTKERDVHQSGKEHSMITDINSLYGPYSRGNSIKMADCLRDIEYRDKRIARINKKIEKKQKRIAILEQKLKIYKSR